MGTWGKMEFPDRSDHQIKLRYRNSILVLLRVAVMQYAILQLDILENRLRRKLAVTGTVKGFATCIRSHPDFSRQPQTGILNSFRSCRDVRLLGRTSLLPLPPQPRKFLCSCTIPYATPRLRAGRTGDAMSVGRL